MPIIDHRFEERAYTSFELCRIFNLSRPTFNKYIRPHLPKIGKRLGHTWTLAQVKIIFAVLDP